MGERRPRSRWRVALGVAVAVVGAEIVARGVLVVWFWFLAAPGAWCAFEPAGETYARLAFVYSRSAHHVQELFRPDPTLGHVNDGATLRGAAVAAGAARPVRVVAVGDSFTEGAGVPPAESWPGWLATEIPNAEVTNLALSGYGLDQAVLRFEEVLPDAHPDVVVLGYFPLMRPRLSLDWNCFAKPRFDIAPDGSLRLFGTPLPAPQAVVASGLTTPAVVWLARLGWSAVAPAQAPAVEHERALVQALVARFAADARKVGAAPLVVYLPERREVEALRRGGGFDAEWDVVRTACAAAGVAFVDSFPAAFADIEQAVSRPDGARYFPPPSGHYSSDVNHGVARLVAGALREGGAVQRSVEPNPGGGRP